MKTLLISLMGTLAIGATLPAFAGPDWQVIQQGRKAKLAHLQQAASGPSSGSNSAGSSEQGTSQHDKMMKECMDMMKKSS